MKMRVAICKTNRIAWDGPDYYVELEAEWITNGFDPQKRLSVKCPRYPKGIFPGVWVSDGPGKPMVPMLAAQDMRPMPKQRRRGYRRGRW